MNRSKGVRSPRPCAIVWFVVCLLAMRSPLLQGQLPTTTISSVFPPGGAAGSTFELTVAGAIIDDVDRLVFSHPAIRSSVKKAKPDEFAEKERPQFGRFRVTIPDEVPPGRYEVRALGRHGMSNPRAFIVGRWKEQTADGKNRSPETAMSVAIPVTVNGRVARNATDYYEFAWKQGQRLTIWCHAQGIDSPMTPSVTLYDEAGNELARAMQMERDAVLHVVSPRSGKYRIAIHDEIYDGGIDYVYRLEVHDRPDVVAVVPLAVEPGKEAPFRVAGWNLPGGGEPAKAAATPSLAGSLACTWRPVTGQVLDSAGTAFPPIRPLVPQMPTLAMAAGPRPIVEFPFGVRWPVHRAEGAVINAAGVDGGEENIRRLKLPVDVSGRFRPGLDDAYEFEARAGEVWWVEVISHRLGSDADPQFLIEERVNDGKGGTTYRDVVQVDDPGDRSAGIRAAYSLSSDDPLLRWTVPRSGTYRIRIRDQFGSTRNDPRNIYRLVMRPPRPSVRIVGVPEELKRANNNIVPMANLSLVPGGTCAMRLLVERREGFDGDVVIEAAGLPAGVTMKPVTIGPRDEVVHAVFRAAVGTAPVEGTFQLQARYRRGTKDVVEPVLPGAVIQATSNRTVNPARLRPTDTFYLDVRQAAAMPVSIDVPKRIIETSLGGKFELPVKLERREEFKGPVTLIAHGFPSTIRPGNVTIKANQKEAGFPVVVNNARTPTGAFTVLLRGDAKVKRVRNPDAIKRAEADQKRLAEVVKRLQQEVAEAEKASKAAQQTLAMRKKQVEQVRKDAAKAKNDAARKRLAEAEAAWQTAQHAVQQAQAKQKEVAAKRDRAAKLKQAADKNVASAKKAFGPRDVNVAVLSDTVTIKIDAAPFGITLPEQVSARVGMPVEFEVIVAKKYGFDDVVTVVATPPRGTPGIPSATVRVEKGKDRTKLKVDVGKSARPGEYRLTVKASGRFNNVGVAREGSVVLKVEAAPDAKAKQKKKS